MLKSFVVVLFAIDNIIKSRRMRWARHVTRIGVHIVLSWESGARGSAVVKALCYKPEGSGIETRCEYISSIYLILPAALSGEFTQPLTEINTRSR
jgi:hypothetical protein